MNELAFLQLCEVATEVVDYRSQYARFELMLGGKRRAYITDCARLLADGTVEIVEIKSDYRAVADPEYAAKLQAVSDACARLNWRFRLVIPDALLSGCRRENVLIVQSRRMVRYGDADVYAAVDAFDRLGDCVPLGRVAEALGGAASGQARAMAMMVGRVLRIDLEAPITPNSPVHLVAGSPISSFEEVA